MIDNKTYLAALLSMAVALPAGAQTFLPLNAPGNTPGAPPPAASATNAPAANDDADLARFKQIVKDVRAGNPITAADRDWALGKVNDDIKHIDDGSAEKAIMANVEQQIDAAIAAGKIPADQKPTIMEAMKKQVEAKLADIRDGAVQLKDQLQKAKIKK